MNTLFTGIKNISQGNFTTEIPVYRTDKFGRLAQSLNSMVEKLKKEIAYNNLLLYDTLIPDQNVRVDRGQIYQVLTNLIINAG